MLPHNKDSEFIVFGVPNVVIYTNHRNERNTRAIIPLALRYGTGPAYETNRWLLEVFDIDKNVYRTYDLEKIEIVPSTTQEKWGCADASDRKTKPESETDRPEQDRESHRPDNTR